jgi:capsular polysaccharide biosynthesis protein
MKKSILIAFLTTFITTLMIFCSCNNSVDDEQLTTMEVKFNLTHSNNFSYVITENSERTLAETYAIILDDLSVYEKIADKFMDEYEAKELEKSDIPLETDEKGNRRVSPSYIKSCVSITANNKTEVLKIQATNKTPQTAADICNYITEVAPDILSRVNKDASIEVMGEPTLVN